jgi:aspartate/methionine/tyrosine aminotransferase
MGRIGTESAFHVLAQAQLLEANGIDVVHLEIGDTDFGTPQNICRTAATAAAAGETHYCNSQGISQLRWEIARNLEATRGVPMDPDCIVVGPGAKSLMFYSILAVLESGDEAIYPSPLFPIFESMINFTGARAVPVRLWEKLDFRLDLDELASCITPRTKLIVLNSPHNPTGGVLEKCDIEAIADMACEHDIVVLSDEIYDHIVYEGQAYSIASVPGMRDRTILIGGFSKTYAMTGWRLGYATVSPDLVDPLVRLIINSVSCVPPFVQLAGVEALTGPQDDVSKMVAELKRRRDFVVDGLNRLPGVSCRRPRGAFYVFPNVTQIDMSCEQLADHLLKEVGVATLPGTAFGAYGDGYLRISYTASMDTLAKGLERMERALAAVRR